MGQRQSGCNGAVVAVDCVACEDSTFDCVGRVCFFKRNAKGFNHIKLSEVLNLKIQRMDLTRTTSR